MTQSRRTSGDGTRQSLPPPPRLPAQSTPDNMAALKEEILNDVKRLIGSLLPAPGEASAAGAS